MRDPPDAETLVALAAAVDARGAMASESERRLALRCLDIVARERRYGSAAYDGVAAALAALYGSGDRGGLLRALARDIRAGRFDDMEPMRAAIEQLLVSLAVQRLRECNPDFLCGTGHA